MTASRRYTFPERANQKAFSEVIKKIHATHAGSGDGIFETCACDDCNEARSRLGATQRRWVKNVEHFFGENGEVLEVIRWAVTEAAL